MASGANENKEKARELFEKSKLPLVEIAKKLGVPAGTVRRWKSENKWGGERSGKSANVRKEKSERSTDDKNVSRQRLSEDEEPVIVPDEIPEGLNSKQYLYCLYYVRYFNATKAYQKAFKCSYESAHANANRMMANDGIRNCIKRLKQEKIDGIMLTEHDIFQKYIDIAFADMTDYVSFGQREEAVMGMYGPVMSKDEKTGEKKPVTQNQNFIDLKSSKHVDGHLITEIRQERGSVTIKLADRMKALQWLSDHMDLSTPEQKAKLELLQAQTIRVKAQGGVDDIDDGVEIVFRGMPEEGGTDGEETDLC